MSVAIDAIKKQLENKRTEKRRLEEALYTIQGYIAALESSLEIVGTSRKPARPAIPPSNPLEGVKSVITMHGLIKPKLHDLAYVVLKEAGKPQTGEQIVPLMLARGCTSSKESIVGAIYRAAKKNDRFYAADGVFGLLEWEAEKE